MAMEYSKKILKTYYLPLALLVAIFLGGVAGHYFGPAVVYLKPICNIFLNLIFTAIVPLILVSVSTAVMGACNLGKFGKLMSAMLCVFILMGCASALFALCVIKIFPPLQAVATHLIFTEKIATFHIADQIVAIFTVPEFWQLFSHKNMLPLIFFSLLLGIAVSRQKNSENMVVKFLEAGNAVFIKIFDLIMLAAPIGFFCYFANIVHEMGPQVMQNYLHITFIYYVIGVLYFAGIFTLYAFCAGNVPGVKLFWKEVWLPALTALATCSSLASIAANTQASKRMGVPPEICETVIPLGSLLNKIGSVMGGMLKIVFLFAVFHLNFSGAAVWLMAIGVSLLVGTVMGAIPSGGMLGELLIVTVYGFPPQAVMTIVALSILIDPLATMLNVTGNSIASMLVARLVEGKRWLTQKADADLTSCEVG